MDERIERLLDLAEAAIGRNDTDQAEAYRVLAGQVSYLRRKEAREMERHFNQPDTVFKITIDPTNLDNTTVEEQEPVEVEDE